MPYRLFSMITLACSSGLQLVQPDAGTSRLCAPTDDPAQCHALVSVGVALRFDGWKEKRGWMGNGSYCTWSGVTCDRSGHVTNLTLEKNGLAGHVPGAIGGLSWLQILNINGKRPASYHGCEGNDLGYSALPDELFALRNLTTLFAENACIGGTIPPQAGALRKLQIAKLHNNAISGTIPKEFSALDDLRWFDLGRNPLSGTFPDLRFSYKLEKYSCNFCALTGTVPDIFSNFPSLQHTFWDGNALSGTLPPSLGSPNLKQLCCVSFDINRMSGQVPPGLCELPALNDCRIGADTSPGAYLGNYSWSLPVDSGNLYECPLPRCALPGGVCSPIKGCASPPPPSNVGPDCSPVKCAARRHGYVPQ